jgi:hypothetical protein
VGNKIVPVDLTITYSDNSTSKIHRSIAVWEKGNKTVTILVATSKKIQKVVLGSTYAPDTNKADNIFEAK